LFNQPVKDADLEASASFEVEGWDRQLKAKVLKHVSIADERRAEADKARAEGRPYERLSDDARGFRNQQTRYTLKPEASLPLNKKFSIKLPATLHGEQGPLAMEKEVSLPFKTYGP